MRQRIGLALTLALAGACGGDPVPPPETPPPGIALVPLSYEAWKARLAEYPPDIVVVDMWATWCAPCIERFPAMVDMHRRYAARGVRFVSMSLEDREDAAAVAGAERFLRAQNAAFDNFRMDENIVDAFEKLDLLGIPAVVIYGRDGRERYRLTGDDPRRQFTDADVEQAVRTLLDE